MSKWKQMPSFNCRPWQARAIRKFNEGKKKRFAITVSRRGGKDWLGLYLAYLQCMKKAGSNVGYLALSLKQLKKILFSNSGEGRPMIEGVIDMSTVEMTTAGNYFRKDLSCIKFKNGSVLYLLGTDQSAELGTSMDMLVISEASRVPFSSWQYLVPSIEGAGGYILQISTPYFGSEFNDLIDGEHPSSINYEIIKIPANELLDHLGNRVYSDAKLSRISKEMSKSSFLQDYFCDTKIINDNSVMGDTLTRAHIMDMIKVSPSLDMNMQRRVKLFVSFDLGNSDSTCATYAIQEQFQKPRIFKYQFENQTALKSFTSEIRKTAQDLHIDPSDVTIILPFDADHDFQGYEGKINRGKEIRKDMQGFNVVTVKKVSKKRKLEVTRDVIEAGDLGIVGFEGQYYSPAMEQWVKIIASIKYKEDSKGRIVYEIDKRSGLYQDDSLDSLSYLVVYLFKDRFTGNYEDDKAIEYAKNHEYEGRIDPYLEKFMNH